MVTKEQDLKKYCCFYVSDFHLEMILLPYIKNHMKQTKFIIFTERNLSESMKILLDRTNLDFNQKKEILDLNWKNSKQEDMNDYDFNECTIIINGSFNYISKINEKLKKIKYQKIRIIDCYPINEPKISLTEIQAKYDETLNTRNIKKEK